MAICWLRPDAAVPAWALSGTLTSITRTAEELSVVCPQDNVPADVQAERGWRCLRVCGPLDLALVGVLASLATPLAQAGISLFAISTYDTDHLLVRGEDLDRAMQVLREAGHADGGVKGSGMPDRC